MRSAPVRVERQSSNRVRRASRRGGSWSVMRVRLLRVHTYATPALRRVHAALPKRHNQRQNLPPDIDEWIIEPQYTEKTYCCKPCMRDRIIREARISRLGDSARVNAQGRSVYAVGYARRGGKEQQLGRKKIGSHP